MGEEATKAAIRKSFPPFIALPLPTQTNYPMGKRSTQACSFIKHHPPPSALPLLARAHILLHTRADIYTPMSFETISACGIMLYGVIMWQLAERNARQLLIDEEEGMIVVDFGRGKIWDRAVGVVDESGGKEEEIEDLIRRAEREIMRWDWEIGKRVAFVLGIIAQG